jgi:flagellar P-ring protein precursor FlgI
MRALAQSLRLMGNPIGPALAKDSLPDADALEGLKKNKNIALVLVSAVVPATGARRGDKLDCQIAGLAGKSLAGGRLAFAALQGPNVQDPRVYGLAQGQLHVEDATAPLSAKIHGGCQIQEDIFTPYKLDGQITLVLENNHADFDTAAEIVETIRGSGRLGSGDANASEKRVWAIDAANIVVKIPAHYADDPVSFVSEILGMQIYNPQPEARVVINERTGSIVISGEVEIGSVAVTHKNLVVETSNASQFVGVDTTQANPAKLQDLLSALNAMKVPAMDTIEIIKRIERTGKLHGRLIVE